MVPMPYAGNPNALQTPAHAKAAGNGELHKAICNVRADALLTQRMKKRNY